jgi:hypothetical protein
MFEKICQNSEDVFYGHYATSTIVSVVRKELLSYKLQLVTTCPMGAEISV